MNLKIILVSVVLVLVSFALGVTVGMSGDQPEDSTTLGGADQQLIQQAIKDLSSKAVPSIATYGVVTKIDGQNITLGYQGDSIVMPIRTDAKIYSVTAAPAATGTGSTAKPASTSEQINFQNIKIGDNLSINFKVLANGSLEGFSVIVLPPTPTAVQQ